MNRKNLVAALIVMLFSASIYVVIEANSSEQISFNTHIRPIINAKCITCHGGVKKSAGLSFLFREEALDTAESGLRAIIPGDAKNSELINRITHHDPQQRMPLDAEPLSEDEVDVFKKWINQGAKWEKHWAYIPPDKNIVAPDVGDDDWVANEIDAFILAKLEEHALTPEQRAPKAVLMRRLYLDLTGLPPTAVEAKAFLKDESADAYEKLVDTLLASPHFGERWAAMWLDLARFSDSKGYEKDLHRSIWKYRDWVIKAFNQDMPFDQFTIQQLAGDLLPNPTEGQLIATAFHRNTMANDEGGTDNEEFRVAAVLERVGTTLEVWQGTTMACVQCHSHPYDPIRHKEFYEFMAFFNNTQDRDIYNEQPKLFTYEEKDAEEVQGILDWVTYHLREEDSSTKPKGGFLHEKKADLLYKLGFRKVEVEEYHASSKLIELLAPEQDVLWQVQDSSWIMFEDVDLTNVKEVSFRCATAISGGFIEIRLDSLLGKKIGQAEITTTGKWESWSGRNPGPEHWKEFRTSLQPVTGTHDVYYLFRKNRDLTQHLFHVDWIFYHEKNPVKAAYSEKFNRKLEQLASVLPVSTPIMRDLPPQKSRKTHVFQRGNWMSPGEEVTADVPDILGKIPTGAPVNRLGMARWLASTDNPLSARVVVNRFWEQLFGYGMIETMEEFGSQGNRPSHPQLLDWLAVQFMYKHDWSAKKLLKQIVMSSTYQQRSAATPEKIEKDPRNALLSRGPRIRLTAEQIRDQVLAVSGLINLEMYGPSIKPLRPDVSSNVKWVADTGEDQHRRSVYVYTRRVSPFPMFITFDATARNVCNSRRIRTNTPLQSLTLLNDSTFFTAAKALAVQMASANSSDVEECLRAGYESVMFRSPGAEKLAALKLLYRDALHHYQQDELVKSVSARKEDTVRLKAFTLVANALMNLDEFITKN